LPKGFLIESYPAKNLQRYIGELPATKDHRASANLN
jgi:hypothetical protein